MKASRYILARLAWTVFAIWLVLSGTFFLFAYTPDPNENLVAFSEGFAAATSGGNASEAAQRARAAYRQARNYDEPVWERYGNWIVSYATFDWGYSSEYEKPVMNVVVDRGFVTLSYLLPVLLAAILLGTGVGLVSATRDGGVLDGVGRSVSYLGVGLPNFWLAEVLVLIGLSQFDIYALERYTETASAYSPENFPLLAICGIVVFVNVIAIQIRYARSETREFLPEDFVKTLRATGTSGVGIGRHVLRNASIPLVSLLFTEVLVAVMINVFVVESVLNVPGLGLAAYEAIQGRDIGLILGTWLLPMLVALFGSLLQDVIYTVLDPRVGSET